MKVNRPPDVRRKLPLNKFVTAAAIGLFASVTFTAAAVIRIAAACAADTVLPQGKAVA